MSTKYSNISDEDLFIEGIHRLMLKLNTESLVKLMGRVTEIYLDPKYRKERTCEENDNG